MILSLKIRMRMDKVYFQVKMELMSHIQEKHYGWTSLCSHKAPQKVATFCLWSYHFKIARCIICLIPMSFGSHLRIIFLVFLSTFVSFHLVPSTIDRGSNWYFSHWLIFLKNLASIKHFNEFWRVNLFHFSKFLQDLSVMKVCSI